MKKSESSGFPPDYHPESGNIIFFILLGIILIGLVTAAIRSGGLEGANIDSETTLVNVTRVKDYASELERAVTFILSSGVSEADIRFAHPDAPVDYGDINTNPANQVFNREGGGASYRKPPPGVNDGSLWEFYGSSQAPDVGSSRADLMAVLPNVTKAFCDKLNEMDGYDITTLYPADDGSGASCVNSGASTRFDDGTQYSSSPNTMNTAQFSIKPAMQACITCTDGTWNFYHVLHAR